MAVHESYRLHTSPDRFFIEPTDLQANELLVIDRVSQDITLQKNEGQIPPVVETKTIYGIVGIVRLLAGPYLVVITSRAKAGVVNGQTIWKVVATEIISYKKTMMHLNEQQIQDNTRYLSMIEHVLGIEGYLFSTTYDVTHTMQRLENTSPDFLHMPLHERADPRFVWNGHLLRELAQQQELSRYCMPLMQGYLSVKTVSINSKSFSYILISRRSCFRAGTRYYMRGVDMEGHAANYVETEQIIEYDNNRASFVQTRGSIPLYWNQYPNLKYKPDPVISGSASHSDGFEKHFAAQIYNYGKQVIVNLLDQKGQELPLVKALGNAVQNSQNTFIRYQPFDFHKECSKMRWHRLSLLTDQLADDLDNFGYFMIQKDGTVLKTQEGVFRTNCIDCLDRTNVVQSLLARLSLQDQLTRLAVLNIGQKLGEQASFEYIFKNTWADNADVCAKQYAGTGALKTDFTRTGKRSIWGLIKDGWNSSVRYFMNNFYDGYRQDSVDLFLGNYQVEETEGISKPSPLRPDKDWKFYALPAIFLVAFSMCVISVLIPDEHASEQAMYVLFWGSSSLITLAVIYLYGTEFVDRPKLAAFKSKVE